MHNILKYTTPLLFLFFSCKSDIEPIDGLLVPVFKVGGETGSGQFVFEAGVDSIYLFTNYSLDSGIANLTGTFANASCAPNLQCPGSLSFTLRVKESEGLPEGQNFPFLKDINQGSGYQTLKITPKDTLNRDYSIQVSGQTSVNLPAQVNLFNVEPVDINIQALDRVNQVKSVTSLHYLPAYPDSCKAATLLARVNDQKVSLRTEISGGSNQNYSWNNGVFDVSEIIADYGQNQSYAVTITGPDAGCTTVASLSNLPVSTGSDWISTTGMNVITSPVQPVTALTGVKILWTNPAGVKFSSATSEQPVSSFFTITKIDPYQFNEKGQSTVQIHIRYQCALLGDSASGLEPTTMSGSGVIGVAIPD
jgi:hypothetical protein